MPSRRITKPDVVKGSDCGEAEMSGMSLTNCSGCGYSVSELAPTCPHCGRHRVTSQSLPHVSAILTSFPLFPVATHKFITLSIFTFSAYSFYWFYQNWKRLKAASHETMSPFWRTVFAPLWGFSLFDRIRVMASEEGIGTGWNPVMLGTVFLAFNIAWNLPDPWSWVSCGMLLPLIPVQQTAHRINEIYANSVGEARNETYSTGNVAIIVIGGLILALIIISAFIPEWRTTRIITVSM